MTAVSVYIQLIVQGEDWERVLAEVALSITENQFKSPRKLMKPEGLQSQWA